MHIGAILFALAALGHDVASEQAPQQVLGNGHTRTPFQRGGKLELEQFIEDTMREWRIPGLAVAIINGNSTWAKVGGS